MSEFRGNAYVKECNNTKLKFRQRNDSHLYCQFLASVEKDAPWKYKKWYNLQLAIDEVQEHLQD